MRFETSRFNVQIPLWTKIFHPSTSQLQRNVSKLLSNLSNADVLSFGRQESKVRDVLREPDAICIVGPRLKKGMIYNDDYEIVTPALWRSLMMSEISSRLGDLRVAIPVFAFMNYYRDSDEPETTLIEDVMIPEGQIPLKIAMVEPLTVQIHIVHFPLKVSLRDAMKLFVSGLGYKRTNAWEFFFNEIDTIEPTMLQDVPDTLIRDLEMEWKLITVRVYETVQQYPPEMKNGEGIKFEEHRYTEGNSSNCEERSEPEFKEEHMSNSNIAAASEEAQEHPQANITDEVLNDFGRIDGTRHLEGIELECMSRMDRQRQLEEQQKKWQKQEAGFRAVNSSYHQSVQLNNLTRYRPWKINVKRARQLERQVTSEPLILIDDTQTEEGAKIVLEQLANEILAQALARKADREQTPKQD